MLNNSPMKFNVPGKLVVPRINRNNEVENTGYMLNELMKAKVNRLRLSVRSYINPTEQNKPLELYLVILSLIHRLVQGKVYVDYRIKRHTPLPVLYISPPPTLLNFYHYRDSSR